MEGPKCQKVKGFRKWTVLGESGRSGGESGWSKTTKTIRFSKVDESKRRKVHGPIITGISKLLCIQWQKDRDMARIPKWKLSGITYILQLMTGILVRVSMILLLADEHLEF